ncbi:hypothetical protein PHLCEN_2v5642 [Hermanssonia centrifuga]|uniref:Uncharacterized protein n=1 Tax=Hermanssonia centrifuga TaxID=98765 RepID=A0A2R6P1S0_9APHY|nr:hypothetical protein PHLCEN_2v5642 [Hermanssonia centrifuga]
MAADLLSIAFSHNKKYKIPDFVMQKEEEEPKEVEDTAAESERRSSGKTANPDGNPSKQQCVNTDTCTREARDIGTTVTIKPVTDATASATIEALESAPSTSVQKAGLENFFKKTVKPGAALTMTKGSGEESWWRKHCHAVPLEKDMDTAWKSSEGKTARGAAGNHKPGFCSDGAPVKLKSGQVPHWLQPQGVFTADTQFPHPPVLQGCAGPLAESDCGHRK